MFSASLSHVVAGRYCRITNYSQNPPLIICLERRESYFGNIRISSAALLCTIYKNRQNYIRQYGDSAAVLQQYFLAEDGDSVEYFIVCDERTEMHVGIVENGVCPEGSF